MSGDEQGHAGEANKPLTYLPVVREHHPHSITTVAGFYGATYEVHEHTRLIASRVVAEPCPEDES